MTNNPNAMAEQFIRPYRNIPFDIGHILNDKDIMSIKSRMADSNYKEMDIHQFLKKLSNEIVLRFCISDCIRLYVYSFGIGVFTIRDTDFKIQTDSFAIDYCQNRKKAHHDYLKGTHQHSTELFKVIDILRGCVRDNHKSIRITANNTWENNGLSYVMTVSVVQIPSITSLISTEMSSLELQNLSILLEPGMVHQEDSMLIANDSEMNDLNEYSSVAATKTPKNWLKSKEAGLYISWAAVIVYANRIENNSLSYLEYLEVDLQAMWMYIYCMYFALSQKKAKNMKSSNLKHELFVFKKKYNSFLSSNDSSMPEYLKQIRLELINTSAIEEEKEKYIEYLEYCIEEVQSINDEKTRKYSIISEVLLFVIAYVQIAPMLYHLLMGDYSNLGLWQICVVVMVAVIGILLVIRKE